MRFNMQPKTRYGIYKILACFLAWILYTYLIVQFLKYNVKSAPESEKLDISNDTYETDQKTSVCFKDIIPFSIPLIQGSEICQNKPELLIMIHTEPDNFNSRNTYRDEFENRIRNISVKYDFKVDVVYLIGLNKHYCIPAKTIEEIIDKKDILVGSFVDNYYNQTLKSITMLEWFLTYCKSATLLLKLDDRMDAGKSLENDDFYSLIRNVKEKEKIIIGSTRNIEVASHLHIPWISQPYLYPGLPRNLHLNYLLSRDSAESLLKAYTDSIYISVWKEDLYVTGILVNIAKLKITHDENFLLKCDKIICSFCNCNGSSAISAESLISSSATEKNIELITSSKLAHSIPKRDAQKASHMYSSRPITTNEYSTITSDYEFSTIEGSTKNADSSFTYTATELSELERSTRSASRSTYIITERFTSEESTISDGFELKYTTTERPPLEESTTNDDSRLRYTTPERSALEEATTGAGSRSRYTTEEPETSTNNDDSRFTYVTTEGSTIEGTISTETLTSTYTSTDWSTTDESTTNDDSKFISITSTSSSSDPTTQLTTTQTDTTSKIETTTNTVESSTSIPTTTISLFPNTESTSINALDAETETSDSNLVRDAFSENLTPLTSSILTTEHGSNPTTAEVPTTTEILQGISITDIPILQIDEFDLGFQAIFQNDIEENLNQITSTGYTLGQDNAFYMEVLEEHESTTIDREFAVSSLKNNDTFFGNEIDVNRKENAYFVTLKIHSNSKKYKHYENHSKLD